LSIEQLINDCKKQNIKAQEQLYRQFAPKLFSVCLKYAHNYAEAQDFLQDGFLLLFEKIHQFEFKGSFEGWAKRVIINNILQEYRSKKTLNVVEEHDFVEQEVEVEIDDDVSMEFLTKIIQELPERYKLVFNLFVFENYNHQDIASALGITIGTSKSNLARARMILKEKIENNRKNYKMPTAK
jgi:RNA polymerase sigma factor (sigma-70 family)